MPFLNSMSNKKNKTNKSTKNTSPSATEKENAKKIGIDLGGRWDAYSNEVRLHIYVSNMDEMVRFYNQILEFPVVRYWRYSDGDGTMLNIGGNIIELFSKSGKNYSKKQYHGNVSLSIKVKDVNKLYDKFYKKNIQIGELVKNPWGDSSFSVVDPEGNRLAFFSLDIDKSKYYKVKRS